MSFFVAAHLRALESEIAPQGVTPLLSVEREAVQNSRSYNPQIFNPISEMQRLWNINNSNTLKTNSHNLFVVSQSCTNPTITDAPTKTSKKSTTKGAMEKAYGDGLSTSASKDLSYLNRMREDDKAKKRRVRNQTKMLLSQLDGLLPAPTSGKPRGVLEIIAAPPIRLSSTATSSCRCAGESCSMRFMINLRMIMRKSISQCSSGRSVGLLVLDNHLAVIDLNPSLRVIIGGTKT